MELDTLYELRKLVDTTLDICDTIEKTGLWTLSGKIRMRHMLQVDLYRFCHYLAASDGRITVKESAFINTVIGINTDINEMLSFIKKENIYSTEFESTVPLIIRGAVEAERRIKKLGAADGAETSSLFVNCFAAVGKAFVTCDGIDEQEIEDYKIYMTTINNYIKESELDDITRELFD